jgi:hypothetical protein
MLFEIMNFLCWQGRWGVAYEEKTESKGRIFRHCLVLRQNSFGATIGRLCGESRKPFFQSRRNILFMKKALLMFFICFNLLSFNTAVQAQCSTVTVSIYQPSVGNYKVRAAIPQPYTQDIEIMGSITPEGEPTTGYELTIFAGNLTGETDQTWQQSQPPTVSNTFSVSICPPFSLSEDQSYGILLSTEFQNFVQKRNDFLDKISTAVNQGTSLDSIKSAALNGIQNNDYQQFYTLVFGSNQIGESFFNSYVSARNALLQANSFVQEHPEVFSCNTCNVSLADETNYFFNNFGTFNTYRFAPAAVQTENGLSKPVCGSYWNQIKLGICAGACGATSLGLAAGLCGWGCWCTFCTRNSAVANVICAN